MSTERRSRPRAPAGPDVKLLALRTAFRTVGTVAPGMAARWAAELFCRPPRQLRRPAEEAFLATGRAFSVGWTGAQLQCWTWGEGPLVILAHGWGSRAGRWSTLAPALLERGYRVVTYDAPAHGTSPGRIASLPEFAQALRSVADASGPVHAVIGHSLGGAAAVIALSRGLTAERAVLIAPPADPETFAGRFAQTLAIPDAVRTRMERNLEARLRFHWRDLHIPTLASALATPALIIHDSEDHDIVAADGEAIARAWPRARLLLTSGLGHRAIIRDPAVVAAAADFLGAAP